jgi:hypothetical protein
MSDVICEDCKAIIGHALDGHGPRPGAHICFDCWVASHDVDSTEWLHMENRPEDIGQMSPVTTLYVVKRGLYHDVADWAEEDFTVTLVHDDLRDEPVPMLMGNPNRKLSFGRATIDGLYVRGTGRFRLRLDAEGHDPIYTNGFKVT